MDLRKGQKIYNGNTSLTVVEVHRSGKTVVVESPRGYETRMRMTTIDEQWSTTKPAKK